MNKELKEEIDNFINIIKDSKEYKDYINIISQMNESNEINKLVGEIKKINKQLVRTPSLKLKSELKEKEELLNNIPLYIDYKDKLNDLNYVLSLAKDKFDKFVQDIEN